MKKDYSKNSLTPIVNIEDIDEFDDIVIKDNSSEEDNEGEVPIENCDVL